MGLDMYLYGAKKTGKKDADGEVISLKDVIYWRKANQIHNWFVNNIQSGVDDCEMYVVEIEELKTLRDICKDIMEDKSLAEELLPTTEGFFFGGTDYDMYYFHDIEYTHGELTNLIKNADEFDLFVYWSSW